MADETAEAEGQLPAGDFSSWLSGMRSALSGERASDVPCGDCTACCRSSQFVHIAPGESETLARIPRELLFPAPGRPEGHMVLGYDENGQCPMLTDEGCSIYEDRPRTCRTYDCRIFPAAGVDADKPLVARRARRWQFTYDTEAGRRKHAAVETAATVLRDSRDRLHDRAVPSGETGLAVLAVEVHEAFLRRDDAPWEDGVGQAAVYLRPLKFSRQR